jgi:hypothetical protein
MTVYTDSSEVSAMGQEQDLEDWIFQDEPYQISER